MDNFFNQYGVAAIYMILGITIVAGIFAFFMMI
jgi:hypothetical protein